MKIPYKTPIGWQYNKRIEANIDNLLFDNQLSIYIGSSLNVNSKSITLDKIYPSDTKLYFNHNFKDIYAYKFINNELTITRIDETGGGDKI